MTAVDDEYVDQIEREMHESKKAVDKAIRQFDMIIAAYIGMTIGFAIKSAIKKYRRR